jgi:hypothetical protein
MIAAGALKKPGAIATPGSIHRGIGQTSMAEEIPLLPDQWNTKV